MVFMPRNVVSLFLAIEKGYCGRSDQKLRCGFDKLGQTPVLAKQASLTARLIYSHGHPILHLQSLPDCPRALVSFGPAAKVTASLSYICSHCQLVL